MAVNDCQMHIAQPKCSQRDQYFDASDCQLYRYNDAKLHQNGRNPVRKKTANDMKTNQLGTRDHQCFEILCWTRAQMMIHGSAKEGLYNIWFSIYACVPWLVQYDPARIARHGSL